MIASFHLRGISIERGLNPSDSPTASKTIPSPMPTLDVPEPASPPSTFHRTGRIITTKSENVDDIVCSDIEGCRTPSFSLHSTTTTLCAPVIEFTGSANQLLSRHTHAVTLGLVEFVAVVGMRQIKEKWEVLHK
jgi:hypothetical protein